MIQYPAFGICGYSGSGKTTLIVELIRRLSADGLKVGVIKHDVHGLVIDREGKDSDRFFKAGADVLMRGPSELFLRAHRREDIGLDRAIELLAPFYDVLLLEGHKSTPLVDKVWLLKDDQETCPPEAVNACPVYQAESMAAGRVRRVLRRDEDRAGIVMELLRTWLPEQWLSTPVYAGVLIGGQSLRMGRPKHLLTTSAGRTWLEQIVAGLQPLQVALLGKGEIPQALASLPLLQDVEDTQASPEAPPTRRREALWRSAGRAQGPLAGMLAAMRWRPDVSWLFLSCDMPRIAPDAIRWLLAHRKPGIWAILPRRTESEGVEPLPGWYDFRARRLLETCRGPAELAGHAKVVAPLIPAELAAAWASANTPSELDALGQF